MPSVSKFPPSAPTPKPSEKPLKPALIAAKPIDLEKLDAAQIRNSCEFDADASGKRALAMLQHVDGLRKERAVKAILAGLYLHQVKLALDHGEFGAWKNKHLGNSRSRSANHYMDLAAKFARSAKLLLPEILGANQLTLDLQAQDSDGRAILAKLDQFVGERGLTDLMHRHGVIKQGGAREPALPAATPSDSGEDTASDSATREDAAPADDMAAAERASAAARDAALRTVADAERHLLKPELWHDLTDEGAALVDAKLKGLHAAFHERLLKRRHA